MTRTQEKVIRRWLADKPTEHGFPTDLWTGPRVAHMIRQEFGVEINPKYMTVWLRRRGFTPQKPRRVPRQRDPEAIAAWLAPIGRASKKSPAAARPYRPDRREWADDGPAGPADLGAAGTDPDFVQSGGRGPREKVSVAAALWLSPRPERSAALLQNPGQRVLRQLVRDRLPGGDDARC